MSSLPVWMIAIVYAVEFTNLKFYFYEDDMYVRAFFVIILIAKMIIQNLIFLISIY